MKRSAMLGAIALVFAAAAAAAEPARIANGVMVDQAGFTLYSFDKDASGKSNCNGGCAAAWPPAIAPAGAGASGDFTVVARDDGARQWAYRGMPLYRFAGDGKAGDVNGDDQGKVWHAIRPANAASRAAGSAPAGYY